MATLKLDQALLYNILHGGLSKQYSMIMKLTLFKRQVNDFDPTIEVMLKMPGKIRIIPMSELERIVREWFCETYKRKVQNVSLSLVREEFEAKILI